MYAEMYFIYLNKTSFTEKLTCEDQWILVRNIKRPKKREREREKKRQKN